MPGTDNVHERIAQESEYRFLEFARSTPPPAGNPYRSEWDRRFAYLRGCAVSNRRCTDRLAREAADAGP